jgi:hypothetical protein
MNDIERLADTILTYTTILGGLSFVWIWANIMATLMWAERRRHWPFYQPQPSGAKGWVRLIAGQVFWPVLLLCRLGRSLF